MRNGDIYGLAARCPNGEICAQRLPWKNCFAPVYKRIPFVRGFPVLIETIVNGIHALNRSAALVEGGERSGPGTVASLALALLLALGLFVVAPHMLSLLMLALGLGGDVDGLSFHVWDGIFKGVIFMAYIALISLVPDIRRVFEYHGAEHKVAHAWENACETGDTVSPCNAAAHSRLHPRCGTTFLLFVIVLSIGLQAVLVPLFLAFLAPEGMWVTHLAGIGFKFALVIPVSCVAYEVIRCAASLPDGPLARVLRAPGLALQRLTTREPAPAQLEVALAALAVALDYEEACGIETAAFNRLENSSPALYTI